MAMSGLSFRAAGTAPCKLNSSSTENKIYVVGRSFSFNKAAATSNTTAQPARSSTLVPEITPLANSIAWGL